MYLAHIYETRIVKHIYLQYIYKQTTEYYLLEKDTSFPPPFSSSATSYLSTCTTPALISPFAFLFIFSEEEREKRQDKRWNVKSHFGIAILGRKAYGYERNGHDCAFTRSIVRSIFGGGFVVAAAAKLVAMLQYNTIKHLTMFV